LKDIVSRQGKKHKPNLTGEKKMKIEIKTEKTVNDDGMKCRKIIDWNCFQYDELPNMYVDNTPHMYSISVTSLIIIHPNYEWRIIKGDVISEDSFKILLEVCVEAGNRLREVNKHLAELRAEWNGEETFII
jgi:hypothetical protein